MSYSTISLCSALPLKFTEQQMAVTSAGIFSQCVAQSRESDVENTDLPPFCLLIPLYIRQNPFSDPQVCKAQPVPTYYTV